MKLEAIDKHVLSKRDLKRRLFTPVDLEKAQLAGLKRIDPNETKLSLAEVIEGYQNEKFQDMHIPVFRQEKNEIRPHVT